VKVRAVEISGFARLFVVSAVALACLIRGESGFAQSTQPSDGDAPATMPAKMIAASPLESMPVHRDRSPTTSTASVRPVSPAGNGYTSIARVVLSLLAVLLLAYAIQVLGKRFFPSISRARSTGAVRVLSRSPVSHKQQIVLLQVGRRVLVVADNGAQMSSLSEIVDADEVASLVGQASSAPSEAGIFDSIFGKARRSFDPTLPTDGSESLDEPPQPDHADVPVPSNDNAVENDEVRSMMAARGEIKSLMDRVRDLARDVGKRS
jgi:flagellar biogenesis protein FliO